MSLMRAERRVPAVFDKTSAEAMKVNLGARRRSWSTVLPSCKMEPYLIPKLPSQC